MLVLEEGPFSCCLFLFFMLSCRKRDSYSGETRTSWNKGANNWSWQIQVPVQEIHPPCSSQPGELNRFVAYVPSFITSRPCLTWWCSPGDGSCWWFWLLSVRWIWLCVWFVVAVEKRTGCYCATAAMTATTPSAWSPPCLMSQKETGGAPSVWPRLGYREWPE